MKWSFRLARIVGIDLRIHWTFFLLLVWLGVSFAMSGAGVSGSIYGLAFVLAIFGCVVLHEFGHALAARRFGIRTLDVTLLPIGGIARLERMPSEPMKELWVAVAGPLVNVAIAAVLAAGMLAVGGVEAFAFRGWGGQTAMGFVSQLMYTNLILVVFNMLPAFPMDGGRVLRALLATSGNRLRATETAASVGQVVAICFGIIGFFTNPFLLFVALFVYLGAEAEAKAERMNTVFGELHVSAAMLTRFKNLQPLDSLGRARDELLAGSQQDFPILDESGLCGVLLRQDLLEGLRKFGPHVPVSELMRKIERCPTSKELLGDAVRVMREQNLSTLPVVDHQRVVGLLTTENLGELLMLREAEESYSHGGGSTLSGSAAPATSSYPRHEPSDF